jgi:FkbM family methyltransferase
MGKWYKGINIMYYAQYKKDELLNKLLFHNKKNGFFIDVGANDGITINSTYFLEQQLQWSGICIEPLERKYIELVKNRPHSICLNKALYNRTGVVSCRDVSGYPEMLSGIEECYNESHKHRIILESNYDNNKVISIECINFDKLVSDYNIKKVDYLKLDTEGSEFEILKSINFEKVDIEIIDIENNYNIDYSSFLMSKGYELFIKHHIDEIYIKK